MRMSSVSTKRTFGLVVGTPVPGWLPGGGVELPEPCEVVLPEPCEVVQPTQTLRVAAVMSARFLWSL